MSNEQRLRATTERTTPQRTPEPTGDELESVRTEVDRIVSAANGVFDRLRATNSEEFLSRSRQTGGQ